MEDVRKRIDYKLITDVDKFDKLVTDPFFHDRTEITEDLTGVKMLKNKVTLDKPVFVGQAVLDYSKLEMYNLFYKTLKSCKLLNNVRLLGGDTDSFFLALTTDSNITITDVFRELSPWLDSSNYPKDHVLYSTANKARLGCFKDETGGCQIQDMVLLKPKMYSINLGNTNINRAKGITKAVVKRWPHSEYQAVLDTIRETQADMTTIQSKNHTVFTKKFKKRGLSAWEDKRCWLDIDTSLPHGHYATGVPPPKRRRIIVPPSGDVI